MLLNGHCQREKAVLADWAKTKKFSSIGDAHWYCYYSRAGLKSVRTENFA